MANEHAEKIADIIRGNLRLVAHPLSLCETCEEPLTWKVKDGCIEAISEKIAEVSQPTEEGLRLRQLLRSAMPILSAVAGGGSCSMAAGDKYREINKALAGLP